jgi:hypothetical protein
MVFGYILRMIGLRLVPRLDTGEGIFNLEWGTAIWR